MSKSRGVVELHFAVTCYKRALGCKDERIDFEGDWDFWLRLRKAGHKFAIHRRPFCCYCIDDEARAAAEKVRTHKVEGMDVRAYLAKTYGITPECVFPQGVTVVEALDALAVTNAGGAR